MTSTETGIIKGIGPRQINLATPTPRVASELHITGAADGPTHVMGVGVDVTLNDGEEARFGIEIDSDLLAAIEADYHACGNRSDLSIARYVEAKTHPPLKWVRL